MSKGDCDDECKSDADCTGEADKCKPQDASKTCSGKGTINMCVWV